MSEDEQKILDEERLRAWPAAEPPPGFADRVLAAQRAEPRASGGGRPSRRVAILAGALALAAATAALFVGLRPSRVDVGARVASARAEIPLGGRAIAVAEADAALSWRVARSDARVEQTRGDVFYRVERGGPFAVATPAGDVVVKGTCFRVEVMDMKIGKQTLGGAAAGAALSAVVLVTVYEGRVLFANERGTTEIRAGERAAAAAGEAPGPATQVKPVAGREPAAAGAATPPAPPADASREQLLARDAEQRRELSRLRAQVTELQDQVAVEKSKRSGSKSFYRPTKEELVEMSKTCTVQYDAPQLTFEPPRIPPKAAEKLGLSPDELVAIERVNRDVTQRTVSQLRAIYTEITGVAPPEDMVVRSLLEEIQEKTGRDEDLEARKQLSYERAGLVPVPDNLNARPPAERALRIMQAVGDEMERELGKAIGVAKAHELREANDGWPSHSTMSGCGSHDDDEK